MYTKTLLLSSLLFFASCSNEQTNPPIESSTAQVKPSTQTVMVKQVQKKVEEIHATSQNGASLYAQKCASCHGRNAEKSALNASKVIAGWSSSKLKTSLLSYKEDSNYGGSMNGIMQGQLKPLSPSDILLVSNYISTL